MSTALVPLAPGRPLTVVLDGWTVYVSVHDAEHLRMRAAHRARIKASHPDRGGSPSRCRAAIRAYRSWLASERSYYEALRLPLPTPTRLTPKPLLPRAVCRRSVERRHARQRALIAAYRLTGRGPTGFNGAVRRACQETGIAQSTHFLWQAKDPSYRRALEEKERRMRDEQKGRVA